MRVNNVLLNKAKRAGFLTKVEVISRQAAEQEDYQVQVEDIISRKGDGEDIQFFQQNEILNHWKESYASWKSDAWGKLPRLPVTKSQILKILSGNPSASDGPNTFGFFDGFEGTLTNNWIANNAASHLTIPTYEGSGQAIHPDIVHFDTPWNGYTYWMAMTPYPNGDGSKENPSIVASNDGQNWEVPSGLVNPIDTAPPGGVNNDTDLIYNAATDELWIYWSYYKDPEVPHATYRMKSSNGTTWIDKTTVTCQEGGTVAVIKEGSTYYMWEGYVTGVLGHLSSSTDGITFTFVSDMSATLPSGTDKIWHLNVFKHDSTYIGLFTMHMAAGGYQLYYAESTDKINWTIQETPMLTPSASGWDNNYIYRTAGEFNATGDTLRLWYSAKSLGGEWYTGYTEATLQEQHVGDQGDWVTEAGSPDYSNADQSHTGSYSLKFSYSGAIGDSCSLSHTVGNDYAVRLFIYRPLGIRTEVLYHGDSSQTIYTKIESDQQVYYYSGGWQGTGHYININAWNTFEFRNINFTAHTFDIVLNGVVIASGAGMLSTPIYENKLWLSNSNEGNFYIDDFIVRKYVSPEPLLIKRKISGKAGIIKSVCGGICG